MPSNDVVLLDTLLSEARATGPAELTNDQHFELFCAGQALKDFDLSTEDLETGRTGGGEDGGIDAFYSFVNGELLDEDTDLEVVKRSPTLKVFMVQATQAQSFQSTAFVKASVTVRKLLGLENEQEELEKQFSPPLVNRALVFRTALIELTRRHPSVSATFVLATKGSTANVHRAARIAAENLKRDLEEIVPNCSAEVIFLGARELLEEARRQPTYTLELKFTESPISGEDSYIVLSKLGDYFNFITDEGGQLRRYIFESNVRDYQGNVEVNADIRRTLEDAGSPEFWWLNNGITIIASKATITGKTVALDDVEVVNGLQTSVEVYNALSGTPEEARRSVLCRIIVTEDPGTRDRIIKATNFQTSVSAASLRATDKIQRDIETYFLSEKWYYDRRKNYYKNQGRPAGRIVSIPYLAQAVMAIGLGEPNNSRARPTSLIKRDPDYERVFDENVQLSFYLWAASAMRQVDAFLKSAASPGNEAERRELRFHLATWVVAMRIRGLPHHPSEVAEAVGKPLTAVEMAAGMNGLVRLLKRYPGRKGTALDVIAKSPGFVEYMRKRAAEVAAGRSRKRPA
jgi:hypothetical protein